MWQVSFIITLLYLSPEIFKELVLNSMLIKIQPDATVCRYLFTAKSLYMFRVSQHPSSGVHKTVTAASSSAHIFLCAATSLQGGSCTVPEAVVTICTSVPAYVCMAFI